MLPVPTILMRTFVTGSHAYGVPNAESDIDLVIRIDKDELQRLIPMADTAKDYGETESMHLRFGCLDLICCTTNAQYYAWMEGTHHCKRVRPVSRKFAMEVMKEYRDKYFKKSSEKQG